VGAPERTNGGEHEPIPHVIPDGEGNRADPGTMYPGAWVLLLTLGYMLGWTAPDGIACARMRS
jgi:hypothetical protein